MSKKSSSVHSFLRFSVGTFLTLFVAIVLITPTQASSFTIRAFDTTAGQKAMVMLHGEPSQESSITVTDPLGNKSTSHLILSDLGAMTFFHKKTEKAGVYTLTIGNQVAQVNVRPSEPKLFNLTLSNYSKRLDAGRINGTFTVKDIYRNPLVEKEYSITTRSNRVDCGKCVTNRNGQINFTVQGYESGFDTVTVYDPANRKTIKQEEIAFLPSANATTTRPQPSLEKITAEQDYIPIYREEEILKGSGNSDSLLGSLNLMNLNQFLSAQIISDTPAQNPEDQSTQENFDDTSSQSATNNAITTEQSSQPLTVTTTSSTGPTFRVYFGDSFDPSILTQPYNPTTTVNANLALSFTVVALTETNQINPNYQGTVTFEATSAQGDTLVPGDYTFSLGDQGKHTFNLSIIFPAGTHTFKVRDRDVESTRGEITVTATESETILNQTSISLNLTSPAAGAKLSRTVTFIGTVSHENTQITVKEGENQLAQVTVSSTEKSFSIPVDLTDGQHQIDIVAKYLPDNSTVSSSVSFSVDSTPPVITSVTSTPAEVKISEPFTITVTSEPNVTLTAYINNQAYSFPPSASGTYTLTANAPLDSGIFPVGIEAADEFNNKMNYQGELTLNVINALLPLQGLTGIPEPGSINLSWQSVQGAAGYLIEVNNNGAIVRSETSTSSNFTITTLDEAQQYIFTVKAIDVTGTDVSLPSSTQALQPLPLPVDHGAASLIDQNQKLPPRHTNSGPEVYFIIALSALLLDFYARARRRLQ